MKTIQFALLTVIAAAPIAFFVACGGDDSTAKPVNKPDASQPDTSPVNTDSGADSGIEAGPNTCATGIAFDNKGSISSWPNLPQP